MSSDPTRRLRRLRPARPAPESPGFTIVELVVALVIAGILSTVILQLVLGQSRFARLQTAREEVQQNARAALDLISSDLRAVGGEAIVAAGPDHLDFRVPRAWGLVCASEPDLDAAAVVFPAEVTTTFTDGTDSLAILDESGMTPDWSFITVDDETAAGEISGGGLLGGLLGGLGGGVSISTGTCGDELSPSAETTSRLFVGSHLGALDPDAGTDVYVFEHVVYDTGDPATPGLEGTWLRRGTIDPGNGAVVMKPVAGPLAEDGLTLRYFDDAGNPIDPAALSNPNVRNSIRLVEVKVTMESRVEFGGEPQLDTDSTLVYLRNRGP